MPQAISLHIGLNSVDPSHYGGWSGPLVACEADAHSMASVCDSRGFQTSALLTKQATRANVLAELDSAASALSGGDILIVSYSGHGAQLPDVNGDEDDGLDETWCLYDGELLDDELFRQWAKFDAGVRIVVFSDSCHSGSIVKALALSGRLPLSALMSSGDIDFSPRAMRPELQRITYLAHKQFYDNLLARPAPPPAPPCSVIQVSGCQDNQLSMDGPFNGAFTGALLAVWANGGFKGSYEALTKAIRKRLPMTQSPNYMFVGASNAAFETQDAFTA
jgi:metacaspase-1